MPINILMPALSPTMETGNLAKWLKKEGDPVKSGDVIAEIETDKATMEFEAVDEGTLGKILVPEGTADVAINQPIAILLQEGEDKSALKDMPPQPTAEPAAPPPTPAAKGGPSPQGGGKEPAAATPSPGPSTQPSGPPSPTRGEGAAPGAAPNGERRPHLRLAARPPARQGGRHRPRPRHRLRPARPHRQGRHRGGRVRQGAACGAGRAPAAPRRSAPADRRPA